MMTSLEGLSDPQILLLAAQSSSEGELGPLRSLTTERGDIITTETAFRFLLSFYPTETAALPALITFLKGLQGGFADVSHRDAPIDTSSVRKLSPNDALRQCQLMRLRPLRRPAGTSQGGHSNSSNGGLLTAFIIAWVHRIESISDTTQPVLELVDAFVEQDSTLRRWRDTYLLPVTHLRYDFYPDAWDAVGVQELENLSGTAGVQTLLKHAEREHEHAQVARDLDLVVAPWVRGGNQAKRRKISNDEKGPEVRETASWQDVHEWILSTSVVDFGLAAKAFMEWPGPSDDSIDVDQSEMEQSRADYAQVGLAIVYAKRDASEGAFPLLTRIAERVAGLVRLTLAKTSTSEPDIPPIDFSSKDLSEADLFLNSLLLKSNELTRARPPSIYLLLGALATAEILSQYKLSVPISDVVRISLFGSEERQKSELGRILRQIPQMTRTETNWRSVRTQLLWLKFWQKEQVDLDRQRHQQPSFLSRVPLSHVETELLDASLSAGQFEAVKEMYLDSATTPLPPSEVENHIVRAIYEAYDNASNGNRTRGGMRRADDILKAFRPKFPQSRTLVDIEYLIKATHSLSFYQLTLQHGVPFKPVSIRVHKDPIALVGKVLDQDQKAYTKLDDLLEIGRNLVRARLPGIGGTEEDLGPIELHIFNAEHRITYLAVTAALAKNDFDTAYSYITTRLSTSPTQSPSSPFTDDMSWRAAYAAGKYRPSSSPKALPLRIADLSKRMDLLALALTLATTPEPLSEILGTWRRCEEEMDGLKAQAVEEERAFEAKDHGVVPGGFGLEDREMDAAETKKAMARRTLAGTSASYEEEAPLGLFDVARGAAAALRKSAFPLRGTGLQNLKIIDAASEEPTRSSLHDETTSPVSSDGGRVRKRDVVSNMVTNGLVTGMGWVLGAQPVTRADHRAQEG